MTLTISISAEAEARLKEKADLAGVDISTYAGRLIERLADRPKSVKEISGPISEEFARSGMSEDELCEFLEAEKHAMRAERRNKARGIRVKSRVVFDCNVYLQAMANADGPCGRCVQLAIDRKVALFVSQFVFEELREVTTRPRVIRKFHLVAARVDEFLDSIESTGIEMGEFPAVFSYQRDPDDAVHINLALAAGAKLIVSRDRDLLDLMDLSKPEAAEFKKRFPSLQILNPVGFLREIDPRK